eukprot:COSAG01_NODE_8115_length_2915_cov_3.376420_1_plen_56_part_00
MRCAMLRCSGGDEDGMMIVAGWAVADAGWLAGWRVNMLHSGRRYAAVVLPPSQLL